MAWSFLLRKTLEELRGLRSLTDSRLCQPLENSGNRFRMIELILRLLPHGGIQHGHGWTAIDIQYPRAPGFFYFRDHSRRVLVEIRERADVFGYAHAFSLTDIMWNSRYRIHRSVSRGSLHIFENIPIHPFQKHALCQDDGPVPLVLECCSLS